MLTKLWSEFVNDQQNERNVKPLKEYNAVMVIGRLSESCVEESDTDND